MNREIVHICQAGHKEHDRIKVKTALGEMTVFDWDKYKDFKGYCTGQDDISRTLINTGVWEPIESSTIGEVLKQGDRSNLFLDFGCHIGWYTLMAAGLGYRVHSYDGDRENLELLKLNLVNNVKGFDVNYQQVWFDAKTDQDLLTKSIPYNATIELVKIDIEGNEQYVIPLLKPWLENGLIKNLFIEISPVFNDSYPALINKLLSYGYKIYDNGNEFDMNFDFPQKNLLFKKN
jgi:hypothetical protein